MIDVVNQVANRICKRCKGRVTVDEVEGEDGSRERFVSCIRACFSFKINGDEAKLLRELEDWTQVAEHMPDESVAVSPAPVSGPPAPAQPARPRPGPAIPYDTRDEDFRLMLRRAAATDPALRNYLARREEHREAARRRAEARRRAREARRYHHGRI